jgi:ribonucrease Y
MNITLIIIGIVALGIGLGIGYLIRNAAAKSELKNREVKGDEIIEKAKQDASDIKYRARKEAKEITKEEKQEADSYVRNRKDELKDQEKALSKKESILDQKISEKDRAMSEMNKREEDLDNHKNKVVKEVEKYKEKQIELSNQLSVISGLTKDEAKNILMKEMEEDAKVNFAKEFRRLEEEAKEDSEKNAKKIVSVAIQRFSGEYVAEKTIGSVEIPSDDVKGRLIGREGRNIRAFEQICGVDLIIDDTPEVVVISSFNVVRKEIARQTLHKLISDGRIHPAKIEEFHNKSKQELEGGLRDLGEKAQMEIGVHGIHPEILKLVGALNWRTSYTQNQYQHALETAIICGTMASELGLNVKQARRAGLLHDIGKVIDASAEGSHALIGAAFAKKYGESEEVVHAIRAHHDDEKPNTVLAHLVAASDALSGARPGARKAMMESYISRLSDIEDIVNGFDGVSKSYAISGGREVRVFVEHDQVSDEESVILSRDIAKKIEDEMSYPGTIRITVIREMRAVGVAR